MTCPTCHPWCAITEHQLAVREANRIRNPDVRIHPCPKCGSTDWATSREMVAAHVASMWERLKGIYMGSGQ